MYKPWRSKERVADMGTPGRIWLLRGRFSQVIKGNIDDTALRDQRTV